MISERLIEIASFVSYYNYIVAFIAGVGGFPSRPIAIILGATSSDLFVDFILIGGIASIIGTLPLYLLGSHFRNRDLLKFLKGKGKFLHISEESYNNASKYLSEKGLLFIFVGRFLPTVKLLIPLLVGYLKYSFKNMIIIVFLATVLELGIFMFIGSRIGLNWDAIKRVIDLSNNFILSLLGIGILIFLFVKRKEIFKKFSKQG
ncbi:MAG: Alkaline phosphatase [candidate division WS6 bacterium 34_10]|uniref:Alkaline phosphatase n=1 Tax=candidate division WS6 bacterium 34_10 TaxID=1641389 RepID=A0A117M0H2_9BACT|nr:MAG: Alkaline phosphatase [candidate division WS6 bacterium 34_10]